jgi:rhamnogalacturonan endolyase
LFQSGFIVLRRLDGTNLTVVAESEEKVEISFTRMWNSSLEAKVVPLNFDKRYFCSE